MSWQNAMTGSFCDELSFVWDGKHGSALVSSPALCPALWNRWKEGAALPAVGTGTLITGAVGTHRASGALISGDTGGSHGTHFSDIGDTKCPGTPNYSDINGCHIILKIKDKADS